MLTNGQTNRQPNYSNPRCACAPRVNKDKWRKVIVPELSSDESGEDDEGRAVICVKDLLWCSDKVGRFFQRLDQVEVQNKSQQAVRQSKPRILVSDVSDRPPPTNVGTIPQWAICASSDQQK